MLLVVALAWRGHVADADNRRAAAESSNGRSNEPCARRARPLEAPLSDLVEGGAFLQSAAGTPTMVELMTSGAACPTAPT